MWKYKKLKHNQLEKNMLGKRKVLENWNSINMEIQCYIEPKDRTTLRSIQFTINDYQVYQLTMND